MSVVDDDADWKTRHVSLLGVAKSFVGQLSIGQDLTKVSLPSVFIYPYSALEIGGSRSLQYFSLLQQAVEQSDPVKRMLGVTCYYISQTKREAFEKKPSNSILGENHVCWIDTKNGKVNYIAEQVSHHPPITCFYVESEVDKIDVSCNFESQGIKFHGNSLGITIRGGIKVHLGSQDEEYTTSKPWPDIMIRNVIFGTKREPWDGEVSITCEKTKLKTTLLYKEEGWSCTNVIYGTVSKIEDDGTTTALWNIYGPVGDKISIWKSTSLAGSKESEQLIDYTSLTPNKLNYLPETQWDQRSSLKVWKEMYKAIIEDDMSTADHCKKVIEDAQRERRKNGTDFPVVYFKFNESTHWWEFKKEDHDINSLCLIK